MTQENSNLYERLVEIVGHSRVRMDKLERLLYSHDLAPLPKEAEIVFKMMPDAVVRPKSAEEVSEIVKLACKERIPIVPRGGASWGLGGAVPCQGGIVLDMASMSRVLRVDKRNMEVEVEAGATWKSVYDEAMNKGLLIGSYPSSAPAATVGGWINTGGIGIGSYKYGTVVNNIRNMEVVLPQGQIVETGFNLVSDHSSGYNLSGLLVGSEGTLGIVTKVTMKAYHAPKILKPISVQFENLKEAFPLLRAVTRESINPLHISFVDELHVNYLKLMGKHTPGEGAVLSIVLEGTDDSVKYEEDIVEKLIAENGGTRLSDEDAQHEWDERYYEFRVREVGLTAIPAEIVFPLKNYTRVVEQTYDLIRNMKMEASLLGVMGDRNTVALLPYFLYDEKKKIKSMASFSFAKKLGDIGFQNEGRPLGFGLFFATNLPKIRGHTSADVMFDIKSALDPYDIMNPGKMLEGMMRCGIPVPGFAMNWGMDAMALAKRVMPKDRTFKDRVKDYAPKEHEAGAVPPPPAPEEVKEEAKGEPVKREPSKIEAPVERKTETEAVEEPIETDVEEAQEVEVLDEAAPGEVPIDYPEVVLEAGEEDKSTEDMVVDAFSTPPAPPSPGLSLLDEAEEHMAIEDYEGAIDIYDTILADDPENEHAIINKAMALNLIDKWGQALQILNKFLKNNPDHEGALLAKGRIFASKGKAGNAVKMFDTILEKNPENQEALDEKAKLAK